MSSDKVSDEIENNNIDFVHVEAADIHGIPRGFTLDADYFISSLNHGFSLTQGLFSINVNGDTFVEGTGLLYEIDFQNGTLYPDLSTFAITPWMERTASVFCDFKLEYGNPESAVVASCTRGICKRQVQKLEDLGCKFYSAMEYEFYVVNKDTKLPIYTDVSYASTSVNKRSSKLVYDIVRNMKKVGIRPEAFHAEYGPAQHEITHMPAFGITGPDNAQRFKTITKDVCIQHDCMALFLSKPFEGKTGSSGHFNHSIWSLDENTNLFYDPNKPYKLSQLAQNWLAGLQEHTGALMCLASSTVNCYERYKPHCFAPTTNAWGLDNRSLSLRVKNLTSKATYIENRMPGAATNPYLVTTACIIAGMDGIKRNLQLKTPPLKGNIGATNELPENVTRLPVSLSEALECLHNDKIFVDELGSDFMKAFTALKKDEIKRADSQGSNIWNWYLDYYGSSI